MVDEDYDGSEPNDPRPLRCSRCGLPETGQPSTFVCNACLPYLLAWAAKNGED